MDDPQIGGPGRRGRRVRDFQRTYKACELCRKKKIRCIVESPGAACLRCQRESKTCIFDDDAFFRRRGPNGPRGDSFSREPSDYNDMPLNRPPTTTTIRSLPNEVGPPEGQLLCDDSHGHDWLPGHSQEPPNSTPGTGKKPRNPNVHDTGRISPPSLHSDNFMRTLVSNNKDAMKLLFEAAVEQADSRDDAQPSSPPAPRNLAEHQATHGGSSSAPAAHNSDPAKPVSQDVLKLWRAFRFTRMGWFTAEEAIAYVDLFHKNLAPLSPVSRNFDSSHDGHFNLITQEPLLCCVILMISSRYHVLQGAGGLARSTLIHHRLWEHCQHLIMRLMFGQEKVSKAKTRTRGSIEALLLVIEWHPQGINLPPASDGWDSSLLLSEADPRDDPSGNHADKNDTNFHWLRDVIIPAKTSDRMSWMLLGCLQSLALELGVCDLDERPQVTAESIQEARLRRLMYIFMEQHSSRLGCPSMISNSLLQHLSGPAKNVGADSAAVTAWVELTKLARTIVDILYPSATGTKNILSSCRYVNIIKHFQQQLFAWKAAHLDRNRLPFYAYEELSIELNHLRAFMNSFGIQVVVDRVLAKGPEMLSNTDVLNCCITAIDYAFIKEVIDSSCQVLESVNRLSDASVLRFCPIRIFFRIITASIFLLKALGLGTRTADLELSLQTLEKSIQALKDGHLDEMHLAFRYGELLEIHVRKFKAGMTSASLPRGIPPIHTNPNHEVYDGVVNQDDPLASVTFPAVDDWMALPFDPNAAPFGAWTVGSDLPEPDDYTRNFLWNLRNI